MIDYFRIGKITTLHGIKGETKVYSTTDNAKRYDSIKNVYLSKNPDYESGAFDYTLEIEHVKYVKNSPIVKFKGFDTIEDSTKLIGYSIYIERKNAVKLSENEYYLPDIIGLKCYVGDSFVGEIKDVATTKANAVLYLMHDKKEILVPFVYDFVKKVDLESKKIHIRTLEGLL